MKKNYFKLGTLSLCGLLLFGSCVGSFSLFNKLAKWNMHATKYKMLNWLIFLVISPAYAICGAADVFVLNSIEFWTGDNPVAANVGKTKKVMGEDGRYYAVTYLENGYEITNPDGEKVIFFYNKVENTWYKTEKGETTPMMHFNGDGTVKAFLPNGKQMDVTLTDQGAYELQMAVNGGTYFALR